MTSPRPRAPSRRRREPIFGRLLLIQPARRASGEARSFGQLKLAHLEPPARQPYEPAGRERGFIAARAIGAVDQARQRLSSSTTQRVLMPTDKNEIN
ncbi:MAG TPA: hypothetical protein DEB40_08700 [Elusimicrobia bacterium]|nr:hypothetical protein [Elusimicrobiota bacterium]HBT61807.1 hypothetical protein [Elusimicrobiota bacterium]